jgi:membrane-bound lytic murein transglycosylase B
VIETLQPADAYVIAGRPPVRPAGRRAGRWWRPWPRHWRALTPDERVELQQRLVAAGYDTGGIDGRIGPKTLAAVKTWQKARGDVPDGYPSPDILEALRNGG